MSQEGGLKLLCVIPARYASKRFRGKPLADIHGKPMVVRTYERVKETLDKWTSEDVEIGCYVATDDRRIVDACLKHDVPVLLTNKEHTTGTDRVAQVAFSYHADWYINVQGDEPFIDPLTIQTIISHILFSSEPNQVLHGMTRLTKPQDAGNPNICKVVTNRYGYCLYASRSLIPYRGKLDEVYRTVGIYAYAREQLLRFKEEGPCQLEEAESNELLRFLDLGIPVRMLMVAPGGPAIDTPEDLALIP